MTAARHSSDAQQRTATSEEGGEGEQGGGSRAEERRRGGEDNKDPDRAELDNRSPCSSAWFGSLWFVSSPSSQPEQPSLFSHVCQHVLVRFLVRACAREQTHV